MRKKFTTLIALAIGITLILCACGNTSGAASDVSNTIAQMLNGTVRGELGKTYSTEWFEFNVKSIEKVDSYAGYTPESGYELYSVLLSEKGTFDEEIPMSTSDFYMDADSFEEYIFPIDPLDDTMMPIEFTLKKGESVEYRLIYEIPAGTGGLKICYTEIDIDENIGAEFTIAIN